MELREIRTFLQIAQKQSFSKAAEALGYSQAAVTVQIKQLEEELGIHLFDRLGKKTVLTHHGEIFYRYAVTILGTVADAKKRFPPPQSSPVTSPSEPLNPSVNPSFRIF